MTLRELVGQLFFVRPDALDARFAAAKPAAPGMTTLTDAARDALIRYPVGGFVLFGKNIVSPDQLRRLLAELRGACATPPLFCVDEEGGRVARLAGNDAFGLPRYESMAAVAAGGPAAAYDAGRTIGGYLRTYGFHLDLAPVADVNTNPDNPVIGKRAFASDAETAAALVAAAVEGLHAGGVGCTLKHFPGHGDTAQDTHTTGAYSYKTWQQMRECELLPFAAGIHAGADAVMSAHITTPHAGGDGLPASLSFEMLTTRLRGELGFEGLILTDSLGMAAVRAPYGDEAALLALEAGADVLLMPADLAAAFDTVLQAAENGRLPLQRIRQSVRRIAAVKQRWGCL